MSDEPVKAVGRRSGRVGWWPAATVLAACVPMAAALAVQGETGMPGHVGTIYDTARWILLAALAATAVTLLIVRRPHIAKVAATTGAVLAVQLVGTGIVAFKHWRPAAGMTGIGQANLGVVRTLAAVLTVAAAAALAACLATLRHIKAVPTPTSAASRIFTAICGILIAAVVPLILGAGNPETADVTSLGAYALLYSLPWGTAVAVSGWLPRAAAVAAASTVAVSALLATASHTMVPVANPAAGLLPAAALAATIAILTSTAASHDMRSTATARS
jgi:hypothetical protein